MKKKKDNREVTDRYEDFLSDISKQFSGKSEERDFLDSIAPSSPGEDIQVNVTLCFQASQALFSQWPACSV